MQWRQRWRGVAAILPQIRALKKVKHIVLDGASIHTSAHTKKWLVDEHLSVIDGWPPYSPDLNPIENLWAIIKRSLDSRLAEDLKNDEETLNHIWSEVENALARIDKSVFKNLVESFPRRLAACVRLKGDWIGR